MRWGNHHSHPGDNRYRVFIFREADHATRFAERLTAAGIGFERHEEDGEVLFGVAKCCLQLLLVRRVRLGRPGVIPYGAGRRGRNLYGMGRPCVNKYGWGGLV